MQVGLALEPHVVDLEARTAHAVLKIPVDEAHHAGQPGIGRHPREIGPRRVHLPVVVVRSLEVAGRAGLGLEHRLGRALDPRSHECQVELVTIAAEATEDVGTPRIGSRVQLLVEHRGTHLAYEAGARDAIVETATVQ